VAIEVPRDDPQPVRLLPLFRQLTGRGPSTNPSASSGQAPSAALRTGPGQAPETIPPITATLGLAEDGAPLLIRLPSPDVAHILVAGTTGSGKTALLQTMILSLAMSNRPPSVPPPGGKFPFAPSPSQGARSAGSGQAPTPSPSQGEGRGGGLMLVLIDPKGHAFSLFEGLPHLARPVIQDTRETTEALQSLVHLMERRDTPNPHIIVVIDELADLLMVGGKAVQRALTRLTQRGRQAGIHVVAATQKPTAAVLGPLVKANFPVRLVGRVTSVEDARTATGWSGTGAERLTGRGDFLAVAEGRVMRFQSAYVSPREIREEVAHLAQRASPTIHHVSLPWPTNRLTEVFRGEA